MESDFVLASKRALAGRGAEGHREGIDLKPRQRKDTGRWEVRFLEGGRYRSRSFDRKGDALDYMGWLRRRQQLGLAAVPDDVPLCELIESYWRLHAVPNLSPATRDLYNRVWSLHVAPRLGDYGVRELEKDPPEVVVIVDADCVVHEGALDRLVRQAAGSRPVQAAYVLFEPPVLP